MTTIATPQFNALIDQLFAESKAAMPDRNHPFFQLSEAEQDKLMASKTEYLDFYRSLKDMPLAVSRETGMLLYMLVRANQALSIVEFGTSFGVSALYLAAALKDNGGGHLLTTEFEPSKVERARANLASAGLLDLVEIRQGDALQTLATDLPDRIDLLLLDGAKGLYPEVLQLVEHRLARGALIIADDAAYSPEYLDYIRSSTHNYLSMPLDGGIELSLRLK